MNQSVFDETAELGVVTYSKRFILGIWTYVTVRLFLMYQDRSKNYPHPTLLSEILFIGLGLESGNKYFLKISLGDLMCILG